MLLRIIHIKENMQKYDKVLMLHQDLLIQNNINQLGLQNQVFEQEIQNLQKEPQNETIIHNARLRKAKKQSSVLKKCKEDQTYKILHALLILVSGLNLYIICVILKRKIKT